MVDSSAVVDWFGSYGTWGFVLIIFIGILLISAVSAWLYFKVYKKGWNLDVEFKMIRSDGHFLTAERGVGKYDIRNGIVWLKRKKKKPEGIKIKDLAKYTQGEKTITAVGNPGNWNLVIPDSYYNVKDDVTGEIASVLELKGDIKSDRAWEVQFDRGFTEAFTIQSLLSGPIGQLLGWGIIIFIVAIGQFIGFSLVLDKIGG